MNFDLRINATIPLDQFIEVYARSGINRPVSDKPRMKNMQQNANLTVSAWNGSKIVGLARCFIDYGWVCYLSDLLVDVQHQREGVGEALVARVQAECGEHCQLVLLSAPAAMDYYPKLGFEKAEHAFYIKRRKP